MKCRNNTESKNQKVARTINGRIILLSRSGVCNNKKLKFLKEQETRGLVNNLVGIKVPILSVILIVNTLFLKYKMTAIVNKLLLATDKLTWNA